MNKFSIIIIIALIVAIAFYRSISPKVVDFGSGKGSIICFGDSITEGYGLRMADSYPYQLGLLLDEAIINTGISGETSSEALLRLKKDVLDKNPRLVIVQFGGNDLYHQISYKVTLANNDSIVEQISKAGAVAVLLIGEAKMLAPRYLEGFREIAKHRQILLIEDAIDEIVKDPGLRIDDVHPNARGYKIIARRIAKVIQSLL